MLFYYSLSAALFVPAALAITAVFDIAAVAAGIYDSESVQGLVLKLVGNTA